MGEVESAIRWGVLGTARIATKVGTAIQAAENAQLDAIGSRSIERAAEWANDYDVSKRYGSYQHVLDDPDIDAVYIPLPPSMHREWTIKAAEAGKHVLCEKPLALNLSEATDMADACRQHNVQLMDGVMWLHHPRAAQMHQPIEDGTLGTLRRVTSAFSFNWDELPHGDFRLERQYGGGSLFDLGWYCVGATLWAFGESPRRVYGTARYYNDIDMAFSGLMWFDNDRMASFDCAFDTEMRRWLEVAGTKASLVCDDFTRPWDADKPRYWLHNASGLLAEHRSEPPIQEVCMIEDFCKIVQSGTPDVRWTEASLNTQRICDALDQSARAGEPVDVNP